MMWTAIAIGVVGYLGEWNVSLLAILFILLFGASEVIRDGSLRR